MESAEMLSRGRGDQNITTPTTTPTNLIGAKYSNYRAVTRHVESVLPWGKELLRSIGVEKRLAARSLWLLTSADSGHLNVDSTLICQVVCFSAL